jgi:hypothetical protein
MKRMNFPNRKQARYTDALTRADELVDLTPTQRLERLDKRLGKGMGAVSERAKWQALIDEPSVPKVERKKKRKSRKSENRKNKKEEQG